MPSSRQEKAVQGRTFSLVTIERAVTESGRIEELPYFRQVKRWWWKTARNGTSRFESWARRSTITPRSASSLASHEDATVKVDPGSP